MDAVFKEALALHEIYRCAKVPAEEIFIGFDPETRIVFVQVKGQDHAVRVGVFNGTPEAFRVGWQDAVQTWNTKLDNQARNALMERTDIRRGAVKLISDIVLKRNFG